MNKKAQFYILISLLLITYAFAISKPDVQQKAPLSTFSSLHQNFVSESSAVINNALHDSLNVSEAYDSFVDDFISFAWTRDPNFGLVYLLAEGDSIVIGNRIKRSITVSAGGSYSLPEGSVLTIGRTSPVVILVGDITYTFPFDESGIQMKALFRKEDQNEVRVYVHS